MWLLKQIFRNIGKFLLLRAGFLSCQGRDRRGRGGHYVMSLHVFSLWSPKNELPVGLLLAQ